MLTPRPYLSFSQMALFERDSQQYAREYIYGEKRLPTINMQYGSKMAEGLENGEASGDPVLDLMMAKLPKFELMDVPFEVDLKNGREKIRLLAKPDTCKADYTAFKEYKTSVRKWTQKMADESGQITFYATCMWLKTGKLPQDIELVNVQVRYAEDGSLEPTGEIWHFPTKRTTVDVLKMCIRIRKVWVGINQLCEKELL